MLLKIENLDQIQAVAKEFISYIKEKKVFAFYGSMGAGKTTFIKALCEELGSPDIVTSPTFTLVNEYLTISIVYGTSVGLSVGLYKRRNKKTITIAAVIIVITTMALLWYSYWMNA